MAAGSTYTPIATTTLSSGTSYTFSSIAGTYTDLVLVALIGNATGAGGNGIRIQYNGDTASNYSWTYLVGDGSSAFSGRNTSQAYFDAGMTNNTNDFSQVIFQIQNYSNTSTYKTTLYRGSSASTEAAAAVSLWRSTSAISSIKIAKADGANFKSGTMLTLYGIQAA